MVSGPKLLQLTGRDNNELEHNIFSLFTVCADGDKCVTELQRVVLRQYRPHCSLSMHSFIRHSTPTRVQC